MLFQGLKEAGCIYPQDILQELIPAWCFSLQQKLWAMSKKKLRCHEAHRWRDGDVLVWVEHSEFGTIRSQLAQIFVNVPQKHFDLLDFYRLITESIMIHEKMKRFREWVKLSPRTEELLQQVKQKLQVIAGQNRRNRQSERLPQSDVRTTGMAASMPVPPTTIPEGELLWAHVR